MKVEVICRETIKPSSPTPDHLRHYQLSFLDQVAPEVFIPLIFFYSTTNDSLNDKLITNSDKSNHLKKSLSEALTKFYPIAGRVIDNLYVDCTDTGVPYVEAHVYCHLSQVAQDPVPGELNNLLPCELHDVKDLPMAIQVNFFDCGGIAISIVISHKLVDGMSFVMFVNSWAARACGVGEIPSPHFGMASLFPPRDIKGFRASTGVIKDKIETKRFVFTASKIASLRDKYTNTSCAEHPRRPSRVEALSAFLWNRFMASTQAKTDPNKIYTLIHAVNLRPRTDPPLPENYFGNIFRFAIAVPSLDSSGQCYEVVNQVRDSISKVDVDYISKLQEGDKHLNFLKDKAEEFTKGEVVSFSVSSLCRFPLYGADFGWGKPVQVGTATMPFKNLVMLMDTQCGEGIEAWVNLMAEDMPKFEEDEELLKFALPHKDAKTSAF